MQVPLSFSGNVCLLRSSHLRTGQLPISPRRYCRKARKEYLSFAKGKKHSKKQVRKVVKKQLSYVRRDLGYLEKYMEEGYAPVKKEIPFLLTVMKLYEQHVHV